MLHQELIPRIRRAYPMVWYHCHTHHPGRAQELSERESTLLGHLAPGQPASPGQLAKHLRIAASTLSECVEQLVRQGFVDRGQDTNDGRRVAYTITTSGREALERVSVLSSVRLDEALERLSADERERAVSGLELLAAACVPRQGEAR